VEADERDVRLGECDVLVVAHVGDHRGLGRRLLAVAAYARQVEAVECREPA
jgi:hypothetical protein